MTSLKEFIARNRIRSTAEWADSNPNMEDFQGTHFKVKLRMGRKSMTTPFSMGFAHTGEPKTEDVLDCLASDASGYANADGFDSWAAEYGYDADSRKAERIYRAVEKQSGKLRAFLGHELYEELLWGTETERL